MGTLEGKVALVTGAGRHGGLGQAICARLAVEGCRVALTDIGEPQPLMAMPASRRLCPAASTLQCLTS